MPTTLVLGYDGSDCAKKALAHTAEVAKHLDDGEVSSSAPTSSRRGGRTGLAPRPKGACGAPQARRAVAAPGQALSVGSGTSPPRSPITLMSCVSAGTTTLAFW